MEQADIAPYLNLDRLSQSFSGSKLDVQTNGSDYHAGHKQGEVSSAAMSTSHMIPIEVLLRTFPRALGGDLGPYFFMC
ncbi:hypothetical protein TCAL_02435 [Tigriopus californicus]|uniref:Uncharacterized protein n=1 Tax=Tigriopus californicus TaxID=6832 RepID=A0A553NY39_TIGCA|nr:hypothetical protein TCAL_02435 [Tigriopus californicus]